MRTLVALLDAELAEIALLAEAEFLTAPQLDAVLREVVAMHSAKLDRVAAVAKLDRGFDVAEAARMDRRVAWAYRLLDGQGPGAVVRSEDGAAMTADGLSEADIAFVDQHLAVLEANHMVPTPRSKLTALVERHGGSSTSMNIASAQQIYYRGLSLALFETERRYGGRAPDADDIVSAALRIDRRLPETVAAAPIVVPAADVKPSEPTEDVQAAVEVDIRQIGERLIKVRAADGNWDRKTRKQAEQIYGLLDRFIEEECKVRGMAAIRQSHLAAFVEFLRHDIYKFYGKSTKDEARSIKQLRAISAKYDSSLRGIAGGTLNRHLTNLDELFAFARGRALRSIERSMRPRCERERRRRGHATSVPRWMCASANGCSRRRVFRAARPGTGRMIWANKSTIALSITCRCCWNTAACAERKHAV